MEHSISNLKEGGGCGEESVDYTCRYATAEDTNFVKRCRFVDLSKAANMDDCVFAEGGGSQEVVNGTAVLREPGVSIANHHTSVCVNP